MSGGEEGCENRALLVVIVPVLHWRCSVFTSGSFSRNGRGIPHDPVAFQQPGCEYVYRVLFRTHVSSSR
jgi:hypothetical protein